MSNLMEIKLFIHDNSYFYWMNFFLLNCNANDVGWFMGYLCHLFFTIFIDTWVI